MSSVRTAVEIDAPPEAVWAIVGDPRNLRRWTRFIDRIEDLPADGLRNGSGYTVVMRFMGVRSRVRAMVLEWEPPSRAVVRLSGLVDATVTTEVIAIAAGRSRLLHDIEYRFRGGPLGGLAARSLRVIGGASFALRHGALVQKRQVEEAAGR